MSPEYEIFLSLVRLGTGHSLPSSEAASLPESIDWKTVRRMAKRHSLSAVVFDGMDSLMKAGLLTGGRAIDEEFRMKWVLSVIRNYDQKYDRYGEAVSNLADFYDRNGFGMMVLKGYGLSLDWPIPCHRPSGDIDIWQFGRHREADASLTRELGIAVDDTHHHHTVFEYEGFGVENHFDFVNTHSHVSNARIEKLFKSLAQDGSNSVEICGRQVCVPSAKLHSLFLIRHCLCHFVAEGITLRQVMDWGFFVEKHGAEIDPAWFREMTDKYYMTRFTACLDAVCVQHLGFGKAPFAALLPDGRNASDPLEVDPELLLRVLEDILSQGTVKHLPDKLIPRVLYKLRRWHQNAWKHRLCYRESRLGTFITGIWSHILKPSSI